MTNEIEVNKADPEECPACEVANDLCLYHEGVIRGWQEAQEFIRAAFENPEAVPMPRRNHANT